MTVTANQDRGVASEINVRVKCQPFISAPGLNSDSIWATSWLITELMEESSFLEDL